MGGPWAIPYVGKENTLKTCPRKDIPITKSIYSIRGSMTLKEMKSHDEKRRKAKNDERATRSEPDDDDAQGLAFLGYVFFRCLVFRVCLFRARNLGSVFLPINGIFLGSVSS